MKSDIQYRHQDPHQDIQLYVDGFWCLNHKGDEPKEVTLLPDGKIDLFLSKAKGESFHITLMGLTTMPEKVMLPSGMQVFAISFNPLATEYILQRTVAGVLNKGEVLPANFWGFKKEDLLDFEQFCEKATAIIKGLLPQAADYRRIRMQELLLESGHELTIQQMEKHCFLSARHLNRYWMQEYGIPLKTYLQILRFRSAFAQIKKGKLYPSGNFADQSHFIKEVKRLSGHLPKELLSNKNGRFIQFSVLDMV